MAVLLVEGFDHLNSSTLLNTKGWTASGGGGLNGSGSVGVTTGRLDGYAIQVGATYSGFNSFTENMSKALPSSHSTVVVGFAVNVANNQSVSPVKFFSVNNGGTWLMSLKFDTGTSTIKLYDSTDAYVAQTAAISYNTWNYVEVKVTKGATGSCEVRLNGESSIAASTANYGTLDADKIEFTCTATGFTLISSMSFDDVYVLDTTGSAPQNDFLGDCVVQTLAPTADGVGVDWAPDSGTARYARVKELTGTFPDGDTSYVSSSATGDIDTYDVGGVSSPSGTIYAVQTNLYARKDSAGAASIAPVIRQGGINYVGTTVGLSTSYVTYSQLWALDPSGGAWTTSTVSNDEFGQKNVT